MRTVFFLIIFCLCVPCMSVKAQSNDAFMAPLAQKSLLLDIEVIDAESVIAVGERGHILISNNGLDWQQQPVPSTATLTGVFFLNPQLGWAVGHDATILMTKDGGHHWIVQHQNVALEKPLMDIHFFDEQKGIAIGAYGLFYRTDDGGSSWQKEVHAELLTLGDQEYLQDLKAEDEQLYSMELASILPHLNRLSEKVNGRIYMAGEAGMLAYSDDNGQHWQRMQVNYYGSFFAIQQSDQGNVLVAGLRGNVYYYDLQQWLPVESGTTSSFNSIVRLDDERTLIVGNNGRTLLLDNEQQHLSQTPEGKAIVDAVVFKGQVIAATEAGIKVLNIK